MTPNKPVTENMKAKVTALYEYLKTQDDFVTKEDIGTQLCISNERTVRDVISVLATKRPIISHSGNKGYKLAKSLSDVDDAQRVWAELSSRMEELEKRIIPLINFIEKCKKYR